MRDKLTGDIIELYLWARNKYSDPNIPFNELHKKVCERFMDIMGGAWDDKAK